MVFVNRSAIDKLFYTGGSFKVLTKKSFVYCKICILTYKFNFSNNII